jgi:exosortase
VLLFPFLAKIVSAIILQPMGWDIKRWISEPLVLPGLVLTAVVGVMYGVVPYGLGHGSVAATVFANLWWMWLKTLEWEHCQLVPVIVLGLIYWKREESLGREIDFKTRDFVVAAGAAIVFVVSCWEGLGWLAVVSLLVMLGQVFLGGGRFSGVEIKGDKRAIVLLGLAMLFYWVGYKIDIVQVSFLSLHLTLGALVLWLLGWNFFKLISFPYLFLFFAWPMPFLDMLAFKLRVMMSAISHFFLNAIGVDAIRVGTAILSAPDFANGVLQGARFSLDVADPCSGIRSLFALTMVTALLAYFTQDKRWKQWLLFACAAPLAVAGNFVRILMLTFGTILFGSDVAVGSPENPSLYHLISGFVVFIVALGGALVLGWILNGGWKVLWLISGLKEIQWNDLKKTGEARSEY